MLTKALRPSRGDTTLVTIAYTHRYISFLKGKEHTLKLFTNLCRDSVEVLYIPSKSWSLAMSKEKPVGSDLDGIKTILIVEDDDHIGEFLRSYCGRDTV